MATWFRDFVTEAETRGPLSIPQRERCSLIFEKKTNKKKKFNDKKKQQPKNKNPELESVQKSQNN